MFDDFFVPFILGCLLGIAFMSFLMVLGVLP